MTSKVVKILARNVYPICSYFPLNIILNPNHGVLFLNVERGLKLHNRIKQQVAILFLQPILQSFSFQMQCGKREDSEVNAKQDSPNYYPFYFLKYTAYNLQSERGQSNKPIYDLLYFAIIIRYMSIFRVFRHDCNKEYVQHENIDQKFPLTSFLHVLSTVSFVITVSCQDCIFVALQCRASLYLLKGFPEAGLLAMHFLCALVLITYPGATTLKLLSFLFTDFNSKTEH